jgi:SAM-dependent methyltransferase
VKTHALQLLGRLRLLGPTYRGYERIRAIGADSPRVAAPDGLPIPPAELRVRVAGTADLDWFLEGGRLAEQAIRTALEQAGTTLESLPAILDFGCGCGRVVRRLDGIPGSVHGSDLNADAVAWCSENLPFARFVRNGLEPPLPLADASFDLVYTLSVLTHLPTGLAQEWLHELTRVLRPGGLLLVTTHGDRYRERLRPAELAAYDRGDVVVRFEEVAGSNLCTTFHPPASVERLAAGLELVHWEPEGAHGNPHQDLFLFRTPSGRS